MSTKTIFIKAEVPEEYFDNLFIGYECEGDAHGLEYQIIDPIASGEQEDLTMANYEEVLADHRKLVRELDVLLNGEDAARQASLCDIVGQLAQQKRDAKQPIGEAKAIHQYRHAKDDDFEWCDTEFLEPVKGKPGYETRTLYTLPPITDGSGREEREEFEKWLRLRYNSNLDPLRTVDGEYAEYIIQNMWLTWKARAELCVYTMIDTSEIHNKIKRIINDIREGIGAGSIDVWAATERQLCDPLLDAVLDEIHELFETPPQSEAQE